MFTLFAPRYLKEAKLILKNARKLLHYKRDRLSENQVSEFEAQIARLERAMTERDPAGVEEATKALDKKWSAFLPPAKDAGWRENCEVFLVAIVIAVGVRTYFLQPFTIPTGSMQPTLNGIIGYPSDEPPPNALRQIWEFVVLGRNYVDVVSKTDDVILGLTERKFLFFFTLTDIRGARNSYSVYAPLETLTRHFRVDLTREYRAGEVIARGHVDAGDHVFVDKMIYNFRHPRRGEIFVFKTTDIQEIESDLRMRNVEGSQFYIKRLAGLPGDELRIDPPQLLINGEPAAGREFQRIMSARDGYRGFANGPPMKFLSDPGRRFQVPEKHYFALGDNSQNSSDSRFWGSVPQRNVMGRGWLVYWPFKPHWGFAN